MSKRDVDALVKEAAGVLKVAMDEAAAIAVVAVEKYEATMNGFCKATAEKAGMPGAHIALRSRAERLQRKRRSTADSGSSSAPSVNERASIRSAKAALRKHPELAAGLLDDAEVANAIFTSEGQTGPTRKPNEVDRQIDQFTILNRVDSAIEHAVKRLPDYRVNRESREAYEDSSNRGELYVDFLRGLARGESVEDAHAALLEGEG